MSKAGLIAKLKIRFAASPATSDIAATDIGGDIYDETGGDIANHDHTGDAGDGGQITMAAHSDTNATGANLTTLTDDSMADALHRHSELSTSDGTPDKCLYIDADGDVFSNSGALEVRLPTSKDADDTLTRIVLLGHIRANMGSLEIKCGRDDGALTYRDSSIQAWSNEEVNPVNLILNPSGGYIGIGKRPAYQLELSTDSAGKPSTNTWTVVSDERIKTKEKPFTDGLEVLLSLEPITYEYNGKAGYDIEGEHIGFNATKEVAKNKAKYLFGKFKAKLNEDDEEETELLNYNGHAMPFILRNAIIELKETIDSQQAQIDEQQNIIDDLTKRIEDLEKK